MSDPRIGRTRRLVLDATRRLLSGASGSALTISAIAKEAGVARKTVYAHWDSVPRILSDLLREQHTGAPANLRGSAQEGLRAFLADVRDSLADPVTRAAMSVLVAAAPDDPVAAAALEHLADVRSDDLVESTGRAEDRHRLSLLVGPIFFAQFIEGVPADDELIDMLAEGRES